MKKNEMVLSALLCAMLLSNIGFAQSEDFNSLKNKIEGESGQSPSSPVEIEDLGDSITFSNTITVKDNVEVTISGQSTSESPAAFTPESSQGSFFASKPAFSVEKGGSLTLQHLSIDSFGEGQNHGVGSVITNNGTLTIGPGVIFGESIFTEPFGSSYGKTNATIKVQGNEDGTKSTLILKSDGSTYGDVIFDKQKTNNGDVLDVYLWDYNGSGTSVEITGTGGKVELGNGIGGDKGTSIKHTGDNEFVLKGDSHYFNGTYTQSDGNGTTTFQGTKYFAGKSNINSGTFKWQAADDTTRGGITFGENTKLEVGPKPLGDGPNSALVIDGAKDTLSTTIGMVVNSGSTLTVKNFDGIIKEAMVLKKQIGGEGTLMLDNDKITLDGTEGGLASGLHLDTKNTQLTLTNFANDTSTLNIIAQGSNGDAPTHNNLDLTINNYKGEIGQDVKVDGTHIAKVTFTGTNTIDGSESSNAGLKVSGTGTAVNSSNAKTTINGNVEIEKATGDQTGFTNQGGGEFTVHGGSFKNAGKISNNGIINLDEGGTNTGSITGSGDIISDKTITNGSEEEGGSEAKIDITGDMNVNGLVNYGDITIKGKGKLNVDGNLTNTSGTVDMSQSDGPFTVSGTVTNSLGTIKGQSATFGTYSDSTGSGTSLELTGDLTINGGETEEGIPLKNALQNSGSVKAGSITVKKGGITNTGENAKIEVKTGETYGDILVEDGGITNGDEYDTKGGTITANNIKASGDVTNKGTIDAKGDITVKDITNTGTGSTEGGKNATITSGGKITASGTVSNVGSKDKITAQSMELGSIGQNEGTIESTKGDITVKGAVTNNAGSITSAGKLNVTGNLSNTGQISMKGGLLGGTVTGSGNGATITNNGDTLTVTGDASKYTGTFSQTAGTTTVTSADGLFGGAKNISGGTLSATGNNSDMYKGKVTLSNGGAFNFNYTGENGSITKDILEYSTGGGSATFSGSGTYTLDSGVGSEYGNIKFSGTSLKLNGSGTSYDFQSFDFENSKLVLGDSNGGGEDLDNYTLNNFHATGNSSVDLNLKLMNGGSSSRYLDSDRLTFGGNSSGNLNVGKVYINTNGQEDGYDFDTQNDIITNQEGSESNVHFNTGSKGESAFVGSNSYTYDLKVKENTLGLTVTGAADENTLYEANKRTDTRKFFIDTNKDDGKYNIGKSLDDESASTGTGTNTNVYFDVYGSDNGEELKDNSRAVLSGQIKEKDKLTDKYGSLFDIKENENGSVSLSIYDLTIQDAQSDTKGGVVASNNDKDSKVSMNNVTVKNNSSSATDGKGGAIYNNGGTGLEQSNEKAPGLYLSDVTFKENTSTGKGGAVYNDSNGYMVMTDVITEAIEGKSGEGNNDIYNAGKASVSDSNFGTLYTNSGSGAETLFTGKNSLSSLVNDNSATVTFAEGSSNTVSEKFDNKATATNKGSLEFTGTSDKNSEFANSGTFTNEADSNLIVGENATVTGNGDGAKLSNSGNVYLQGDASGYKGTFTQDAEGAETTVVGENAKFFGGESNTVSKGTLNWGTTNDLESGAKLTVSGSGTEFNIGDGDKNAGSITFGEGSSIADGVKTNIYGNGKLAVDGGNVTLGNGAWFGEVDLTSGDLTLNGSNNYHSDDLIGKFSASGGNLTLKDATQLVLAGDEENKSEITKDVKTNIGEESTVVLFDGGSLTLNSAEGSEDGDTWSGTVTIKEGSSGSLTLDGYKDDIGTLKALGGSVNITNESSITFSSDDEKNLSGIGKAVQTTIDGNSTVTLEKGGYLELDDDEGTADTWAGTVNLSGGTLDYGIKNPDADKPGKLDAQSGNLNLLSGSVLKIKDPSEVNDNVSVDIRQGSTVDIQGGAKFNISGKDTETSKKDNWHGLVKNEGGEFTTDGLSNRDGGGQLQQETGSSTFKGGSDILISGDSHISGGDVSVLGASSLTFASGDNLKFSNFTMDGSDGTSSFSILNGVGQTVDADNFTLKDNNDFALDVDLRGGSSDKFNFKEFADGSEGNINVSDFGFVGGAPVYRNVELQLFDADNIPEGVTFSATDKQVMTPIGEYGLKSLGGGRYLASLGRYNPKVFRGQASTLAMYNNQLAINDLLLNHIILHSEKNEFGQGRTANRYAAVNPLFAPYQYTRKEGGLWYKSYVDIERLSMTQNLNVNNTAYGSIIGADLPLISLENGWDFIPTFYVAYNGSNQSYNGVDMYQNGGQGGFMGTFMKNDFIGSVLAYGGGYFNEMNVEGFTDKTGNWFAGTAAKAAYNLHATQHFTIQPTALVSYNAFGKQSWGTDFGVMGMNSGMLNGINVAPGLNLIYARDTWSLYATFQYMFNINDHVGGHAGVDVDLPNLSMRHGYFQYGIGATKTFKDRFNSYFQFVVRNGGRTGVGFQLGLQYLFDWTNVGHKKQTAAPAKKSVIKDTDKNTVPVNVKNNKSKQSKDTKPAVIKNSKPVKVNNKPVKVNSKVEINNESKNVITTQDGVKKTVIKQLKK